MEATVSDIKRLGLERGHWTLTVTRKGGKVVTVLFAPRTARPMDLAARLVAAPAWAQSGDRVLPARPSMA